MHNTHKLTLNYRVNQERTWGELISNQTQYNKKWIVGESGTKTGEQLSWTRGELALNYQVNQEVKGLAMLDYS